MKKMIAILLTMVFALTAVGATGAFGGIFAAGAEFYDYFTYTPIPGFSAFSETALKTAHQPHSTFKEFSAEGLPEGSAADKLAVFTVTGQDEWGGVQIHSFDQKTNTNEGANWQVLDLIEGTDIFGDSGANFDYATGLTFYVGVNGVKHNGHISVTLFQTPAKGPYYTAGDYMIYPIGALYTASGKYSDSDGYIYFDFGSDFHQADWWSTDDEGEKQWDMGNTPIPKSKLPILNGLRINVSGVANGDEISIGDFRICYDTRIHTDELDEQLTHFDSLDPEAYTEESYAVASDAYLNAYEFYLEADSHTQREIDEVTTALRRAIKALVPLFHARYEGISLASFESWSEEDLDLISNAGLDTAVIDTDTVSPNTESSVLIMANAVNGEPTYGWSWFTSGMEEGGGITAIGNPFAIKEGSEPLSAGSGIRFWVKWDPTLLPAPVSMTGTVAF